MFEKDLFKVLRENIGEENLNTLLSEKVVPVAGDISTDNFGVKDSNLRERMQKEINIVVNVAATTNFDERYLLPTRHFYFLKSNLNSFILCCI